MDFRLICGHLELFSTLCSIKTFLSVNFLLYLGVSPHVRDCELIYKQLMKQAENFSYLKSVQNTKMKLVNAVTP